MKWIVATLLTGSVALTPATAEMGSGNPSTHTNTTNVAIYGDVFPTFEEYARAREQARHDAVVARRKAEMSHAVNLVLNRVGKTPYSFGGSTPSGWDCSGLVMWMYSKLGIDLPHSAAAQLESGRRVKDPHVGDIVVWGGGYHSGIYIGGSRVVNALNYYRDTNVIHTDYLGGGVVFVRVFEY